jgi:hypothetical protein
MKAVHLALSLGAVLLSAVPGRAQDPASPPPPDALQWTVHFDAGWGSFGFANSLFTSPKNPGVAENLSDQWFEGYIKPGLSAGYMLESATEIYGKVSAAGERTYGSMPRVFGDDVSSFGPEDMYIGWRSAKALTIGENALDISIGRAPFKLGHGMLLYDGSAEGGSRGGYWSNARQAFELAAIGRLKPGPHTVELFYLDRDDLPESETGSRLWGANYEVRAGESTFGVTYFELKADPGMPERDGLNVFNARAYTTPIPQMPGLSFEAEYAREDKDEVLASTAWNLQAGYQLQESTWTPEFSYRYAYFQGDDPATAVNEAFDPLFPGFHDWGQWWQGEIAGEYFLSNSNLISHRFRAHVAPSDAIGSGLMFFTFDLDQPGTYAAGVTDKALAYETNWYLDWKLTEHFTVSVVAAYATPRAAVQQAHGRTKDFAYGMAYVAYSY